MSADLPIPPPREPSLSQPGVEELSVEELRDLLAENGENERRDLFRALTDALGPSEASRRWLAAFSASDAAPT
jgi:hypothetical protein